MHCADGAKDSGPWTVGVNAERVPVLDVKVLSHVK
jgi:hypothetical protein